MKDKKPHITQQGLESSLFSMMEWGYKACERGLNIQAARFDCAPAIIKLVEQSNLPKEILRIKTGVQR